MTARLLLTVACNRPKNPHVLARVYANSAGATTVTFQAALRTMVAGEAGLAQAELSVPTESFETDGRSLYCANCRRRFHLTGLQLSDALRLKRSWLVIEHEGFMRDPLAVLRRRHGST